MNSQYNSARNASTLSDIELDAVSGGAREQVTREQWERIVAQQIKNASSSGSTKGGGASGSW